MTTEPKPYLLIDVDGVLTPVVEEAAPAGFARHKVKASTGEFHEMWLNPAHGVWLNSLHERFELEWVTGWKNDAPRLLGPILRLPPMRVIEFAQRPELNTPLRKLPDVREFVGDAPTAWIDDDLEIWTQGHLDHGVSSELDTESPMRFQAPASGRSHTANCWSCSTWMRRTKPLCVKRGFGGGGGRVGLNPWRRGVIGRSVGVGSGK